MAAEAHLSGSLVRKELLILIGKIEKNIMDSLYTPGILQRANKLLHRLQKG